MESIIFTLFWRVPYASGFHLRNGTWSCETCSCKFEVEWPLGAVPAPDYSWRLHERLLFPQIIEAGSGWNTNFPSICGWKDLGRNNHKEGSGKLFPSL
jgi:hypothetical protein